MRFAAVLLDFCGHKAAQLDFGDHKAAQQLLRAPMSKGTA